MSLRTLPSQALLRELLHYNPDTGVFVWAKKTCKKVVVGREAGSKTHPYCNIRIGGQFYAAHRLAFMYMLGHCPPLVDHADGDSRNNCWANLRPATVTLNAANSRRRSDNKSGFKGVAWNGQRAKWRAMIRVNGKRVDLGHFDDPSIAGAAYAKAAVEYFGEYARGAA